MKLKVLLDMDGVIANFYSSFAKYINENYRCSLDITTTPPNYSFEQWGRGTENVNFGEASRNWIIQGGFRNIQAFDGASDFVNELSSISNLYIVTARVGEWDKNLSEDHKNIVKSDTYAWLEEHDMPTENLYFVKDKVPFCQLNGITVLIEDKLDTALKASKEGLHTILINTNYNSSPADRLRIYRVSNLREALEWVKKLSER